MSFKYHQDQLQIEGVDLAAIAEEYGTPCYVYSESILKRNAQVLKHAFIDQGFKVSYAMKANPNPAFLKYFRGYGLGVDIVSGGELQMALHAGFKGSEINFAGVGKTAAEITLALGADIAHFNVESVFELAQLNRAAKNSNKQAKVLLRLNPDIDPQTHPHISTGLKSNKFGMDAEQINHILHHQDEYTQLSFDGLHCHIGSQILNAQPFYDLIDYLADFTEKLSADGIEIAHIDLGGGFGVNYEDPFEDILTTTPYLEQFAEKAKEKLGHFQLHIQPGRVLMANSCLLVTTVLGNKENGDHRFVVVDGATTDLIRPALYDAYHAVYPHTMKNNSATGDIVGPVCESSDALVKQRALPELDTDDYVCIASAGAYGSSMGSMYNMRPLSPEILVRTTGKTELIRRRQTFEEMIALYR